MNVLNNIHCRLSFFASVVSLSVLSLLPPSSALSDGFWPLGEKIPVQTLSETYVPFKGKDEITNRPKLMIEAGDAFLGTGQLHKGYDIPVLGAVWQPRLWAYLVNRATFQTFDNHAPNTDRETEFANRLDAFFNLQLTGTEKILLQLRPTDNNQPQRFSRYTFEGQEEGWENETNVDVESLFFEGDLGSLIPNLDPAGVTLLDFGYSIGRQGVTFQEGIILNDTIDAVGFVRNNLVFPGTSNLRLAGMWGWNRLDRNDRARSADSNMFGFFGFADTPVSTYNLDIIYVEDNSNSDGLYIGASAIQRLRALGGISTAFRVNSSVALEDEIPGNVMGDGTLITAEFSSLVKESFDIIYLNLYAGIDNFTQAGREPILGGPLANTGVLFASPNLSTHGAEIIPFVDDTIGFATGYQAFWEHGRRNLILELGTRYDYNGGETNAIGTGFQLQQAVGQHVQLQLDGWYTFQDGENDDSGARFEVLIVY